MVAETAAGMALPYELSDVFPLTVAAIENAVKRVAGGVYVLDPPDPRTKAPIGFVGRSDTDVADGLHRHAKAGYTRFAFAYTKSPMDGYRRECQMWHDWKPSANPLHPTPPAGNAVRCLICNK